MWGVSSSDQQSLKWDGERGTRLSVAPSRDQPLPSFLSRPSVPPIPNKKEGFIRIWSREGENVNYMLKHVLWWRYHDRTGVFLVPGQKGTPRPPRCDIDIDSLHRYFSLSVLGVSSAFGRCLPPPIEPQLIAKKRNLGERKKC